MRAVFQYVLFLCLDLVAAAPLTERDVTSGMLSQLIFYSEYAGASYCYSNVHGTGNKLSCSTESGSCPAIESAQTTVIKGFTIGATETNGFIAIDDTNKLIVVSIQGTSNAQDRETDLQIGRVNTNLCGTANTHDGCEVHEGFWNAANDVFPTVEASVSAALKTNPSYKVVSAGHSLGGAVAALLATGLRNSGIAVDLYTYGQPKLGSADISAYIQNQAPTKGANYRVTHSNDIVPQLPEHALGDWDHFYPEFWINKEFGTPQASDIERVDGTLISLAGNEGDDEFLEFALPLGLALGLAAHLNYFGGISDCNSDAPGS